MIPSHLILRVLYSVLILLLQVPSAQFGWAVYGGPDPTFGTDAGRVAITGGPAYSHMLVTATQPDDRILIAGICRTPSTNSSDQTCVARLQPNGLLDTEFGQGGFYLGGVGANNCVGGGALNVAPDGKIYVGGQTTRTVDGSAKAHFCIVRLDASGKVDLSCGISGVALSVVDQVWYINFTMTLHRLPSGALVLTSQCAPAIGLADNALRLCATSFLAEGGVDTRFGTNGVVKVTVPTPYSVLVTSTASPDKLYFTGFCNARATPGTEQMCVARMSLEGVVDSSWGNSGWFMASVPGVAPSQGAELIEMSDGSSLVAGACVTDLRRGCLVRLLPGGTIDTTFGDGGVLLDDARFGMSGYGAIAAGTDNVSLVLSGRCGPTLNSNDLCIWRVSNTGQIDGRFGDGGVTVVAFSGSQKSTGRRSLARQRNAKLIVSANCVYADASEKFCATRLAAGPNFFDIDSDNQTRAETDGVLYLRHWLGYKEEALTTGALGGYADRAKGPDIASYLATANANYPNCNASIVGAPGGVHPLLDGVVLIRTLLGLTGDSVTNGIIFPAGTARTTWTDIRTHLTTNCGMTLN